MRAPASTKTPAGIKQSEIFTVIKAHAGVSTILDSGFQEVSQKFQRIYKDGMNADQALAAFIAA